MITVAYIVHSLNTGGAERLAVDMAIALAPEFRMVVFCLDEPGIWAQRVRDRGIPVHTFYRQPGIDLTVTRAMASAARKLKVDILHAHQYTPWFYATLAKCVFPGVRVLFQEHGRHYPENKKAVRCLVNRLVLQPMTRCITAVSRDVKDRLVIYEGLSRKKIGIVYNGTRPTRLYTDQEKLELKRQFGFCRDDLVIGTIGRLDPVKNIPLFLNAYKRIAGDVPGARPVIIGDGPEMPALKALCRELNLEDKFVFAGYREDASVLAAMFDLFILSSYSEGTSMALLEAMNASVPAIVTDVGGNPEIVEHGRTGWITPSNDVDALAAALLEACSNTDLRQKMGHAARERFLNRFQFDGMLESYRTIYQRMCSGSCAEFQE